MIGTSLSHYRITAKLGQGGMGVVYRATDENLGRDVAIKVLPEEVANDEERLARFKREAHLLAALNHTNIASIHGLEEAEGKPFLVLELVEGEDLSTRIERGPVPIDEAIKIAMQIAEALDEAHENGIVHRDLKPANIKTTEDDRVKVLDFGLAKAFAGDEGSESSSGLTQSPTMSAQATQAGVILGTAAYMSPEQARGKPVGKRADIWAFGVVLLEMLTGRQPFRDDTVSDTLAAVLKVEPDLSSLPPELPPSIRRLIEHCLRKDPHERLRDIGDAALELREAFDDPGPTSPVAGVGSTRRGDRGRTLLLGIALGLAGSAIAWWAADRQPEPGTVLSHEVRFPVEPPAGAALAPGLALSPDARMLVFSAREKGSSSLWLRHLGSTEVRQLPGTEDAILPFFSPDGRAIGFFAGTHLKVLEVESGDVRSLAGTAGVDQTRGGSWGRDGTIIYAPNFSGGLMRVAADGGGEPVPATQPEGKIGTHRHPAFLPDGRHFLYYASEAGATEPGEIHIGELGSRSSQFLTAAHSRAIPAGSDRILYTRGTQLVAHAFDAAGLSLVGQPRPLGIELPAGEGTAGHRELAIAGDGTLAYRREAPRRTQLFWVDRQGDVLGTLGDTESWDYGPQISPDGSRVAVSRYMTTQGGDIWIYDVVRDVGTRLTSDRADNCCPAWSPDGRRLAFSQTVTSAGTSIRLLDLDRAGPSEEVASSPDAFLSAGGFHPDGTTLVVDQSNYDGSDLIQVSIEDGAITPLIATRFREQYADFSPDGRFVVYSADDTGRYEIYVTALPPRGSPWRLSSDGGSFPRWSPVGNEVFFVSLDGLMMASAVSVVDELNSGSPVALFDAALDQTDIRQYDVSSDGQRFLVARTVTEDGPMDPITVVLGLEPLQQR